MRITCPHCGFSRDVPNDKVPARSVRATCPKCKHKFQFRRVGDEAVSSLDGQDEAPAAVNSPSHQPDYAESDTVQPEHYEREPSQARYANTAHPREGIEDDSIEYQEPPRESGDGSPIESVHYAEPGDEEAGQDSTGSMKHDTAYEEPENDASPASDTPGHMRADNPDDVPFQNQTERSENSDRDGQDIWAKLEAMERNGGRRRLDETGETVDDAIPWEHLDRHGFLNGFASTIFKIMFKPLSFFGNMARDERETPHVGKALVFNILISELIVLMDFVWLFVGARTKLAGGDEAQELLHVLAASPGMELLVFMLLIPFMFALAAYIDAGLIHLLLMLFRGAKRSFAHTFRTICYSGAPLIILAIPVAGQYLSPLVMVWSMSLQAIGLQRVHGIASTQALAAVLIKWTLYVLLFMQLGSIAMP
ncbi:YIP1 family protein [Desulfovibrio inopinatus]|uniref:YIP1 family protein n=1 Tax=Desulfovibrio inopinatus TaxID=102109 RepID=UPI000410C145|nr:YIP1 family protein [Desulfovibrio inopinatus]